MDVNKYSAEEIDFLLATLDVTVDQLINFREHVLDNLIHLGRDARHIGDDYDGYDDDGLSDVEADAMTLASAGWGTDEDYGHYHDDEF